MAFFSKVSVFGIALVATFVCISCSDDQMVESQKDDVAFSDGEANDSSVDVIDVQVIPDVSEVITIDVPEEVSAATPDVFKCKDNASCAAGNPCTQDWCNVGTGECQHIPLPDHVCTDGDACTTNDICTSSGQCIGAKQVVCNDNSACTKDSCDKLSGCVFEPIDAPCTDNDVCTKNDTCIVGVCTGTKVVCDDGLDCTDDSCDKNTGCAVVKLNNLPCNDGSACSTNDLCVKGACVGAPVNCSDNNQCTQDTCDKSLGCFSTQASNNSKCSDGNGCTQNDNCQESKCISGPQKNCDDSSVCTDDSCDSVTGDCLHFAAVGVLSCSDNNACTYDDTCKLGVCTGKNFQCNDALDCTLDTCDKKLGCLYTVQDKAPCDDKNPCTVGDTCSTNKCEGKVKTCEDGNDCTIDKCDGAVGNCSFTANDGFYCSDGSACTDPDVCKGTVCVGLTILCDDSNPCTSNGCNQKTGCVFTATPNAPCDDGNKCTTGDICQQSVCAAKPVPCDDGNTCTKDVCSKATGACTFTPYNDTYKCDDGDPCTTADSCLAAKCTGLINACDDSDPCTVDSCDPKDGKCVHTKKPNCPP